MIHDIIREATHASHKRLDLALSWLDLGKPRYYASFLRGQAEALFPIEAALARNGVETILPDWPKRARSTALEHDLIVMDASCDPLPEPHLDNPAQMFGTVYVLEATRMGARVMLSRLAQYPESCSIGATKYLRHGFGQRLWPTFLDVLETHPAALSDPRSVVQGAEIAFGMFESALIPIVSTAAE
jgi:heme oxygenase